MSKKYKNPSAVALGRLGGVKVTPAKCEANRQRMKAYWEKVLSGTRKRKGFTAEARA